MPNNITYTVTTIGGSRQHEIEGTDDNFAATELIESAYSGETPGFFLPNPPTFYTLSNVISVSFEGSISEVIQELERKLGFSTEDEADDLDETDTTDDTDED